MWITCSDPVQRRAAVAQLMSAVTPTVVDEWSFCAAKDVINRAGGGLLEEWVDGHRRAWLRGQCNIGHCHGVVVEDFVAGAPLAEEMEGVIMNARDARVFLVLSGPPCVPRGGDASAASMAPRVRAAFGTVMELAPPAASRLS